MAVALLDAWAGDTQVATPSDFAISAGSDRILLVYQFVNPFDASKITGLQAGNQAMTHHQDAESDASGGRAVVSLLYLLEAGIAAMADNVIDTPVYSGSTPATVRMHWGAAAFSGVDQTTPFSDTQTNGDESGTVDPITVTLTKTVNGFAVAGCTERASSRSFTITGVTEQLDQGTTNISSAVGHQAVTDTGSIVPSFDQATGPTQGMAVVGVMLTPVAVAGGTVRPLINGMGLRLIDT